MRGGIAVLSTLFLVACGTPGEEPTPEAQAVAQAPSIADFAGRAVVTYITPDGQERVRGTLRNTRVP